MSFIFGSLFSCSDDEASAVDQGSQDTPGVSSDGSHSDSREAVDEPEADSDSVGDDSGAQQLADESAMPAVPPSFSGDCDPEFRGPFCEQDRIIGFEESLPSEPTPEQVRAYSLAAVNHIRARTCLEPLVADACLNDIGERALEVGGFHAYFRNNCMNQAHGFGRRCECNWAQENIGLAYGSRRSTEDGIQVPLCGMMEEPFGQGHRANIENPLWERMGVGIEYSSSGASWHHEFGCNAELEECPK